MISNLPLPYSGYLTYEGGFTFDLERLELIDEWETQRQSFGMHGRAPKKRRSKRAVSRLSTDHFFKSCHCMYCKTLLDGRNLYDQADLVNEFKSRYYMGDVKRCPNCSWWLLRKEKVTAYAELESFGDIRYYEGIVYQFDLDPVEEPLTRLRERIHRGDIDLRSVSPQKLELLVGSVMRDYLAAR